MEEKTDYKSLAQQWLEGIPPAEGKPFYVLAAGGPGSYKRFLSFLLQKNGYESFICINDQLTESCFPKNGDIYPHHEKTAAHVNAYYDLVDEIVKEAAKRKISIIFEDHGDYPNVYQKHIKELASQGYENFLITTTMSPSDYNAKIDYLMAHEPGHYFREWGNSYHQRVASHFDKLVAIFDKGILIETKPGYISDDGFMHAHGVMRFSKQGRTKSTEILDDGRYQTFQRWKEYQTPPEFQTYFQSADTAMESRNFAGSYAERVSGSRAPRKRAIERSILDRVLNGSIEVEPASQSQAM